MNEGFKRENLIERERERERERITEIESMPRVAATIGESYRRLRRSGAATVGCYYRRRRARARLQVSKGAAEVSKSAAQVS